MAFSLRDMKVQVRESIETGAPRAYPIRRWTVLIAGALVAFGLSARAAWLQTEQKEFLLDQGDARHVREVRIAAHRGVIQDRHGELLAISTPVESVWAVPRRLATSRSQWPALVQLLEIELEQLHRMVAERIDREFLFLRRHVTPDVAEAVRRMRLPGVHLQREYRRYYPAGEVVSHIIGFTDIDDHGQEGMELAYDKWLKGTPGAKHVIQDRLGRFVEDVAQVRAARPGADVTLSLDLRVQTLAYRALKRAVTRRRARSGSVVVLDARNGEILAMANQPSYNPNNRGRRTGNAARNRAVTDVIEPGSTVKPFTVAAALEAKILHADSPVDTSPGSLRVGRHLIRDIRNFGLIDVTTVLKQSSNVGASKIALATPPDALWRVFSGVGFGVPTESGFPGESGGILTRGARWPELERATLAFGYGLSVSPLQLARAYLVLANEGRSLPVQFVPAGKQSMPPPQQVLSAPVATHVRRMLETVVAPDGTGRRAQVLGYGVAGKTGTARKSEPGGYAENRYVAMFAGVAPATAPRLVVVVVVDEPQGKEYYGGQVAAPVFAEVVSGTLRLLGVPPDRREAMAEHVDLTNAIVGPHSRPFSSARWGRQRADSPRRGGRG